MEKALRSKPKGEKIRSVQFHPEYTVSHIRFLLGPRRESLVKSSVDFDAVIAGLVETPESRTILNRFEAGFVRRGESAGPSQP